MTDAEIAWAAGLFEGEGSFSRDGNRNKDGVRYGVRLSVRMTDKDVLERFCSIVNSGTVNGPYKNGWKPEHKPIYQWHSSSWREFIRIANLFLPWMGERRRAKFQEYLADAPKYPRGSPACPPAPFPSLKGYERHRSQGTPCCDICKESMRMYFRERNNSPATKAWREAHPDYFTNWREARKAARLAETQSATP